MIFKSKGYIDYPEPLKNIKNIICAYILSTSIAALITSLAESTSLMASYPSTLGGGIATLLVYFLLFFIIIFFVALTPFILIIGLTSIFNQLFRKWYFISTFTLTALGITFSDAVLGLHSAELSSEPFYNQSLLQDLCINSSAGLISGYFFWVYLNRKM